MFIAIFLNIIRLQPLATCLQSFSKSLLLQGNMTPHGTNHRTRETIFHAPKFQVQIPPAAWMFVYGACCVFLGRDLSVGLISPPEESNGVWCVLM
jgi:hypothetical protein